MRVVFVLGLLAALVLAPTGPASADCPDPGSQPTDPLPPPTRVPGTVSFTGGGWGHGIGMSQYGARGAADLGCTAAEILAGYYPNTTLETRSDLVTLDVGILRGPSTAVTSSTLANTGTGTEADPVVFDHAGVPIGTLDPGERVEVSMATTSRIRLAFEGGPSWTQPEGSTPTVTAALAPTRRLEVVGKSAIYNRGQLRLEVAQEVAGRFEHVVRVPMEDYLLGLTEMPYSWPTAALRTQAIAGRSYAQAVAAPRGDCTCTIYDSVRSQVYSGGREEVASPTFWARWRDAVQGTAGRVLRASSGRVATTFYSSSNGGVSQGLSEAWGSTDVDYLPARSSARWENAAAGSNPRHRWVDDLTARSVADAHGLAVLSSARVAARTSMGRAAEVEVTGYAPDGDRTTRTVAGESAIRSTFGVLSNYNNGVFSNYVDVTYTWGPRRRLAGPSRYGTAAAAARTGWPGRADVVVVARGDDPADALGGVALAGHHDAPLLLSTANRLADAARDEVERLGATTAYVLGGTAALGTNVETGLRRAGVTDVLRVAGPNRFATMAAVARETAGAGSGVAFVVRARGPGDAWADALAISGVAARRATEGRVAPVLGVGTSGIPPATATAIREHDITEIVIVGGPAVVSEEQEQQLAELSGVQRVERWSGANRYLTSTAVAEREPGDGRDVVVVTGANYPDGLAAGALAGRIDATLLLAPNILDTSRSPWRSGEFPSLLAGLAPVRDRTTAVGGPTALSLRTIEAVSWYLTPDAGAPGGTSDPARAALQAEVADEPGTEPGTGPSDGRGEVGGPEDAPEG